MSYVTDYPMIFPLDATSPEAAARMWQHKFKEWEYEEEVRILSEINTPMKDGQPSGPGVKTYRKGALKSVVLGANVSEENIAKVSSWLAQRDDGPISLFRAAIHTSEFRLMREPVST